MSDALKKMAIAAVKLGKPVENSRPDVQTYDYSHRIPKGLRGYQLRVSHQQVPGGGAWVWSSLHHGGQKVGQVRMGVWGDEASVEDSELGSDHRNQGLGTALYEAAMAHAYHSLGVRVITGDTHSSSAHRVHEKLARRHGLDYRAHKNRGPVDEDEGYRDSAYGPYEYALKAEVDALRGPGYDDAVKKSLGPALLAAIGLTMGGANLGAANAVPPVATVGRWSPQGLDPELLPIAHLESSFGANVDHVPDPKGPYYSAQGALGLKPVVAHEEYLRSKTLRAQHPGLETPESFTEAMKNHGFYNKMATIHWAHLKSKLGSPTRAAYGWRWGPRAAAEASEEKVQADPYVQKFHGLGQGLKKAAQERLAKEENPDIRRLIDANTDNDWSLALRQPDWSEGDIDYLLDKVQATGRHIVQPSTLAAEKEFKTRHALRLLDLHENQFEGEDPYRHRLARALVTNHLDSQIIDRLLERPHKWFENSKDDDTFSDLFYSDELEPRHLHRYMDYVASPDNPVIGGWIEGKRRFDLRSTGVRAIFDRTPDGTLPHMQPADVDKVVDWVLANKEKVNSDRFVEDVARHPQLSDAAFQKLMASDHLGRAHLAHRQMSDSQLKSFLTDPRFHDPNEPLFSSGHANLAVSNAVKNQKVIGAENQEIAARSPHSMVRRRLAQHASVSPQILERLADDSNPQVISGVVRNPTAPPTILDRVGRRSMDALANDRTPDDDRDDHLDNLNSVLENPATSSETLGYLMNHPGLGHEDQRSLKAGIVQTIALHPNLTDKMALQIASGKNGSAILSMLNNRPDHPAITPDVIRAAFNNRDINRYARSDIANIITDEPSLAQHLTGDDIHEVMKDEDGAASNASFFRKILTHPAIRQDDLEEKLKDPIWADAAVKNPRIGGQQLLDAINGNRDHLFLASALQNPNVGVEHLDAIGGLGVGGGRGNRDNILRATIRHGAATPEYINKVHRNIQARHPFNIEQGQTFPLTEKAIAENPKTDAETLRSILTSTYTSNADAKEAALNNGNLPEDALESVANNPVPAADFEASNLQAIAKDILGRQRPDTIFPQDRRVAAKMGVGKLRRIRDLIWERSPETGEVRAKDLPPGDWNQGRVASGNISAKKLQEVIDAQPALEFNTSDSTWDGAQRHTVEPSNVFQVNLTDDHVKKMRQAGVYGSFLNMMAASHQSAHPVLKHHTIGWVRWTGGPSGVPEGNHEYGEGLPGLCSRCMRPQRYKQHNLTPQPGGIQIDEIQSDFGQSFVRQAKAQAAEEGLDVEEAGRRAEALYPDAHFKVISNILFGGRHSNEVLGEAFMQHLRNKGWQDTPVHIHDAQTKGPLSQMDMTRPLPGHMLTTYTEWPKKAGMTPSTYGQLPTQSNKKLAGKPTWAGKARKHEEWLQARLAKAVPAGHIEYLKPTLEHNGESIVDASRLEGQHPHLEALYRQHVLNSVQPVKKLATKLGGYSRKVVYSVPGDDGRPQRFMVKPFHEPFNQQIHGPWARFPIHGWAEVANQAVYHAASMGHLHQKVQVIHHAPLAQARKKSPGNLTMDFLDDPRVTREAQPTVPTPRGSFKQVSQAGVPALVIHLEPKVMAVCDLPAPPGGDEPPDDLQSQARQIALLDFLTNNLDRNQGNLLFRLQDNRLASLLAIDHGQSFCYHRTPSNRYREMEDEPEEDNILDYLWSSAHYYLKDNLGFDSLSPKETRYWLHTFDWWRAHSQGVRKAFEKSLDAIVDPQVKEHLEKNFGARATHLDEIAAQGETGSLPPDWHRKPVRFIR